MSGVARRASLVHTVFATAAIAEDEMKRADAAGVNRPPLNLLTTTPINTVRLILRFGPVANSKDVILDLLAWKDPLVSAACMLAYVILCIYPILVLVLPQLVILGIIAYNYRQRQTQPADPSPVNIDPPVPDNPNTEELFRKMSKLAKSQYAKNLQFLQNLMGVYCDAYDQAVELAGILDWSDADRTQQILNVTLAAIPGALVAYYFVPLNWVALVAGLVLFLQGTSLWATVTVNVPKVLHAKFYAVAAALVGMLPLPDTMGAAAAGLPQGGGGESKAAKRTGEKSNSRAELAVAEIFENQRWWAGIGWANYLLSGERQGWSDAAGNTVPGPLAGKEPPSVDGWEWDADAWTLDHSWTATDANGWVYTDHYWEDPLPTAGMVSLTRRRRWIRRMRKSSPTTTNAQQQPGTDGAAVEHAGLLRRVGTKSGVGSSGGGKKEQ
ncbi:Peroxin/Dysferlin domain-containing protein [Zopfochytrium polystomum]|nr:Peroxin/Dysferlin domain-containing protein [Zopfochytrium polystomum]